MFEFKLPDLGEGIHEGELLKWYVRPGERIGEDEPLVEVETDKAAVTIPSPVSGIVVSLGANVGEIVAVGQVMVVIESVGAQKKQTKEDPQGAPVSQESSAVSVQDKQVLPFIKQSRQVGQERAKSNLLTMQRAVAASSSKSGDEHAAGGNGLGPVPAAPATRRLARQLGVDLHLVKSSDPSGRISSEDVQRFAAAQGKMEQKGHSKTKGRSSGVQGEIAKTVDAETKGRPSADRFIPFLDIEPLADFSQWGSVEREPLRSIRRKVARKMTTSKILVPHVAHMDEADVTALEEFRRGEKERLSGQPGGKLTLLAFVIKAVVARLRAAPMFNASLDPIQEEIIYKKYFNVGIAVDSERGLVVPVLKQADQKSILQLSEEIEALVHKTRQGTLDVEDLRGGTFTITNIGPLGGRGIVPAISYPEVAILGMGRVQEKPVVREGQIVIRKMLPLTLAFDHRVADGADAARFVSALVRQLSHPNVLLLET